MIEYNVYIVDLDSDKEVYLYTTLDHTTTAVSCTIDRDFYKKAVGINRAAFRVVKTEEDDRSRDDLIFDYIIEKDDSTSSADSK